MGLSLSVQMLLYEYRSIDVSVDIIASGQAAASTIAQYPMRYGSAVVRTN
jgi:hypothetical protein